MPLSVAGIRKVKVAQCWDDGVVNDERLTQLFRMYNAKATFNLNPGLMLSERQPSGWNVFGQEGSGHSCFGYRTGKLGLNEIKDIYGDFQVASHGWRHESAGLIPDEDFLKSALDTRHFLEDLFQRDCPGYAWPSGFHTPETCRLLKEAGFKYARTARTDENTDDVLAYKDPMLLCPSCHHFDQNFFKKYQAAKKTGVFYFWGHSYELMEYDKLWDQIEQKIRYISQDPDAEWVDVIDLIK